MLLHPASAEIERHCSGEIRVRTQQAECDDANENERQIAFRSTRYRRRCEESQRSRNHTDKKDNGTAACTQAVARPAVV
jgi:hypothetical protein